jgi:hypothetical protein
VGEKVICFGEIRNACKVLVEKSEGNKSLDRNVDENKT